MVYSTDIPFGDASDVADATGDATVGAVTFAEFVTALSGSCGTCHGGPDGCSISTACFLDDAANLSAPPMNTLACPDEATVADCALTRIADGSMPIAGAEQPAADAEAIATLQAYVDSM
jgi:mono/diheme cytochrome c family protein